MEVNAIRGKLDFSMVKDLNKLSSELIRYICEFTYNITKAKEDREKAHWEVTVGGGDKPSMG